MRKLEPDLVTVPSIHHDQQPLEPTVGSIPWVSTRILYRPASWPAKLPLYTRFK
jgi:hypothetical protein